MIPKIIHYIWLGNKPIPKLVKENNKVIGPDWKVKIWRDKDFTFKECKFIEEAYKMGLYMYCSDALRLYILKEHGGVYLDIDVKLYRTPDNLLDLPYAIGDEEFYRFSPNTGIIMSEPHNNVIELFWNYYVNNKLIYDNKYYKQDNDTDKLRRLLSGYHKKIVSSINEYKSYLPFTNMIRIFEHEGWETYDPNKDYSFCEHCHQHSWDNKYVHNKSLIKIDSVYYTDDKYEDIYRDPNIKIFLCAHKPIEDYIPHDKRYIILAQNKNVNNFANNNFHDVIDISEDEFTKNHWICYGEGCAMRYLWKHPELLPNYVCFGHYRRIFWDFMYNENDMINTINKCGIIVKEPFNKWYESYKNNIGGMYFDHFADDINTFFKAIKEKAPEYWSIFYNELCTDNLQYNCNMFAMKKEHFLEMCEMCFNVLDYFDELMNYHNNHDILQKMINNNKIFYNNGEKLKYFIKTKIDRQQRLQGYLLEYLTELYYRKKFGVNNFYVSRITN